MSPRRVVWNDVAFVPKKLGLKRTRLSCTAKKPRRQRLVKVGRHFYQRIKNVSFKESRGLPRLKETEVGLKCPISKYSSPAKGLPKSSGVHPKPFNRKPPWGHKIRLSPVLPLKNRYLTVQTRRCIQVSKKPSRDGRCPSLHSCRCLQFRITFTSKTNVNINVAPTALPIQRGLTET